MTTDPKSIIILVAEDDPDDRLLDTEALAQCRLKNEPRFVQDGEELMEYLQRRGKYSDPHTAPMPGLILLDLKMPRKDGREALKEIKADAVLRRIPVVVMTTSKAEEDILKTYDLGVNSFICKPVSFETLVQIMQNLTAYWFEIVQLPNGVEA